MYPHRFVRAIPALLAGILLMAAGNTAPAADSPTQAPSALSKQMREQMATMHEQMAACLRSDKSMSECRSEMMQQCQQMMGKRGCSMMGMGGMMGMGQGMHGHMMACPPSSSRTPK